MEDVRRFGFTVIAEGDDSPQSNASCVTIVLIHGLRGGPRSTWEAGVKNKSKAGPKAPKKHFTFLSHLRLDSKKTEMTVENPKEDDHVPFFWPKDLLPQDLPNATILTYGYDADVIGHFFESAGVSKNSISQHGQDLMVKLEANIPKKNPIIFIAHSLGGIIVKDALRRAKFSGKEQFSLIHKRTHSIIFLGTPHRGSGTADFGSALADIAALSLKDMNTGLLNSLKIDSEVLTNINDQFSQMLRADDFWVHCFQEGHGYSGWRGISGKVVNDFSSRFDECPQQVYETIGANHMQMAKFASREDEGYRQVLQAILSYIDSIQHESLDAIGSFICNPPVSYFVVVYSENPDFVSRNSYIELLERLHDNQHHSRFALVGMAGTGKSQIALNYAYKLKRQPVAPSVFWVRGSDPAKFEADYRHIATTIGLPESRDLKSNIMQALVTWLSSNECGRWLMIIDNADNDDFFFSRGSKEESPEHKDAFEKKTPLIEYIPQTSNGTIIFTTKDRRAGLRLTGGTKLITVEKMALPDAKLLLERNLDISDTKNEDVAEFLEEMGHLPLAIVQSAALMHETQISVKEYLQRFRSNDLTQYNLLSHELTDLRRDGELSSAVMTIVTTSLNQIKSSHPWAAELISLMGFLDWQNIPRSLFALEEVVPSEYEDALGTLKRRLMITAHQRGKFFEMHRLVHLAVRIWVTKQDEKELWARKALKLMSEHFPDGEQECWETCAEYSQHAKTVVRLVVCNDTDDQADTLCRATLLYKLSWFLWYRGDFSDARKYVEEAFELRRTFLDMRNEQTLDSLSLLATICRAQGNYKDAENLSQQELSFWESLMGRLDKRKLVSAVNLASALLKLGKYKEAENHCRQVLETSESFPMEKGLELTTICILVSALTSQGRHNDAEPLSRKVLREYKEIYRKGHSHIITSMATLATVLWRQKNYLEAEQLSQEVVSMSEVEHGVLHPDTLTGKINLAVVFRDQGKYQKAEEWCRQALEGLEETLGLTHPHTLACVSNLASILHGKKEYKEAETLYWRAATGKVGRMGNEHPSTLLTISRLIGLLRDQGKYEEAEKAKRNFNQGKETHSDGEA